MLHRTPDTAQRKTFNSHRLTVSSAVEETATLDGNSNFCLTNHSERNGSFNSVLTSDSEEPSSLMVNSSLQIPTTSGGLETGTVQLYYKLTRDFPRASTPSLCMELKTAATDHLMLDTREASETASSL